MSANKDAGKMPALCETALLNLARRWPGRPVLRREFDSPEMGAGRGELDAYARALFRSVAQIDDAAFLLFFGDGINEHQIRPEDERFMQVEKTAVRVDHDGLAVFLEFAAFDVYSRGAHGDAREDARTAALGAFLYLCHRHKQSCNAGQPESTIATCDVPKKHSPSVQVVKGLLKLSTHT